MNAIVWHSCFQRDFDLGKETINNLSDILRWQTIYSQIIMYSSLISHFSLFIIPNLKTSLFLKLLIFAWRKHCAIFQFVPQRVHNRCITFNTEKFWATRKNTDESNFYPHGRDFLIFSNFEFCENYLQSQIISSHNRIFLKLGLKSLIHKFDALFVVHKF